MADGNGGGNSALGMIVGILIAVVAIGGVFLYTGGHFGNGGTTHNVNLTVKTPGKPG